METNKYLGILEAKLIKHTDMKEKIKRNSSVERENYTKQTTKTNLIKWINTWTVALVRYSAPFLKWTREELQQMEQTTRKLMTIRKFLHPRQDVDRLYVSKRREKQELPALKTASKHPHKKST